jgi:hypothetical protein
MDENGIKCCEMMEYHSKHNCKQHKSKYDCPDTLIDFDENSNNYQIIIHDGGSSGIEIKFCPWCGRNLEK